MPIPDIFATGPCLHRLFVAACDVEKEHAHKGTGLMSRLWIIESETVPMPNLAGPCQVIDYAASRPGCFDKDDIYNIQLH